MHLRPFAGRVRRPQHPHGPRYGLAGQRPRPRYPRCPVHQRVEGVPGEQAGGRQGQGGAVGRNLHLVQVSKALVGDMLGATTQSDGNNRGRYKIAYKIA